MTTRSMEFDPDQLTGLVVPLINLNPFDWLGDKAKEGLADGWTSVMISVWSAGLWLLEAVFKILDRFLTPDPIIANVFVQTSGEKSLCS